MAEEYLQVAFEIKASCDDISRRLLRWHWEQRPGAHSLGALLEHIERRRRESPDYYDRLPTLENKTSWQQLDTTLCMRVLLDPEKDAAKPLDLLGSTPRPAAARRACNAVRAARNAAAHAADRSGAIEAALSFNEAVESLEEGYLGTAMGEKELAAYYRAAEQYLARCKGEGKAAAQQPEVTVYPTGAAREKAAAARGTAAKSGGSAGRSGASAKTGGASSGRAAAAKTGGGTAAKSGRTSDRAQTAGRKRSGTAAGRSGTKNSTRTAKKRANQRRRKKQGDAVSRLFFVLAALALAVGLLLRARAMGYLNF